MHASRNKRGRKPEDKNRIGARSLQTPWLRCKSSTDFKRKCRLQAVHWLTANFENEPHSSLLQFNQSLVFFPYVNFDSLRKHPFLVPLRRCGRFARKRPQRRRARRNGCLRRLKLWRSCDIVLRCLQNKVEKRINELPELLPSLFTDFMEIKNLHFEIFYYRRHNKEGVSILSSEQFTACWYIPSVNEKKLEMVFFDCFFAEMDFILKVQWWIKLIRKKMI